MHQPVLLEEVMSLVRVKPDGVYLDGTAGSGGHSLAILRELGRDGFLLAMDRDSQALERARTRLSGRSAAMDDAQAGRPDNYHLVQGNFSDLANIAAGCGVRQVDGVILDLGVSSEQLEQQERGFSFRANGPLDMRMDQTSGVTAADLLNSLAKDELKTIMKELGEERRAERIARAIIAHREKAPFRTANDLSVLVEGVYGGRRGRIHPATKVFQAFRMKVNEELDSLEKGLEAGLGLLKDGGRMAVISFHSLEDRIVKRFFRDHAGRWVSLEQGGEEWQGALPAVRLVTRKPIVPGEEEIAGNPRARSAKLRVAERLKEGAFRTR